jgi:hypothetical protein
VKNSGCPETEKDHEFSSDMDIISDLLKTTLTGAVDKFSHSYSTLCDTLSLEIK